MSVTLSLLSSQSFSSLYHTSESSRDFSQLKKLMAGFSIAYGVIVGVFSYIIINGFVWVVSRISKDRILPPNYDASEPWVIPPGGIVPTWIKILLNRNTRVVDEIPAEYPFQVRQRHSNISVETTSQDRFSPNKATFIHEK